MEKMTTQIETYIDSLEDDVIFNIEVEYEIVEECEFIPTGIYGNEPEICTNVALFIAEDIKVLNTDLSDEVKEEFISIFENYREELQEILNENINN